MPPNPARGPLGWGGGGGGWGGGGYGGGGYGGGGYGGYGGHQPDLSIDLAPRPSIESV